jgi:hypothetical protein
MRILFLFLVFYCQNITYSQQIKFGGNLAFAQKESENLSSSNKAEYKLKLYEHPKFSLSLSNALNIDLDHFKNEIKEANVFTTLSLDF